MASEQPGIPRRLPIADLPTLSGGATVEDLRRDVQALADALHGLQRELEQAYDALARRVNDLVMSDTLANRPAAGVKDRLFFATDQALGARLFWDTGSAWVEE